MNRLLLAALLVPLAANAEILDGAAAIVNGDLITLQDVDARAAPDLARVGANAEARANIRVGALDVLIGERLLEAEIKTLQLEVTSDELDHAVEEVRKQNNLDEAHFAEALTGQGLTMAAYKEQLKKQLARMKLLQIRVKSRVKVSDEDLKNAYAREVATAPITVKARHIFVAVPATASPEQVKVAEQKAERALSELKAGKDFAVVARDLSDGPTAKLGGDLGWIKRGDMLPEIEKAAFALEPGQVSGLIRARGGFHLVKVDDKKREAPPDFEAAKAELSDRLTREQLDKESDKYLVQLRKDAHVDVKMRGLDGKVVKLPDHG